MVNEKIIEELLKLDDYKKTLEQINDLISIISTLEFKIKEIEQFMKNLSSKEEHTKKEIEKIVNEIRNSVEQLESKIGNINEKLNLLEGQIASIKNELNTLKSDLDKEIEKRKEAEIKYKILMERLKELL